MRLGAAEGTTPFAVLHAVILAVVAFLGSVDDAVAAERPPFALGRAAAVGRVAVVLAVVAFLVGDRHAIAARGRADRSSSVEAGEGQFERRGGGMALGMEDRDLVHVVRLHVSQLGRGCGVEGDRAWRRRVKTAQVDRQLPVDEDPEVVVAHEVELVALGSIVLEPVAHLAREAEVVLALIAVRVQIPWNRWIVKGGNLRAGKLGRRKGVVVDGEEERIAVDARLPLFAIGAVAVHVGAACELPKRQLAGVGMIHVRGRAIPRLEGVGARDVDTLIRHAGEDRLAVAVERVLDHSHALLIAAIGRAANVVVGFEVRGIVHLEVAEDGWHQHLVAQLGLLAGPAGLDFAVLRTAVTTRRIAVVAVFVEHDAVAAFRGAGAARAIGFDLAVFRAAVERHGVAVVAAFGAFLLAVAADGLAADAGGAVAFPAGLDLAQSRAAIAVLRIAIVARFAGAQDAVAALGRARFAGHAALPARLDGFAISRATVAALRVAVVASLVGSKQAVAALREVLAGLARLRALVVAFHLADLAAAVAAFRIAVVTLLGSVEDAVAARALRSVDTGVGRREHDRDAAAASAGVARLARITGSPRFTA